jgi:2'-5' RNA ligase
MEKEKNKLGSYTFALVSEENNFNSGVTDLAQKNFSKSHANYILGDAALPHITLCQFKTTGQELSSIKNVIRENVENTYQIKFQGMYFDYVPDYIWVGLAVKREQNIINTQNIIYTLLQKEGVETLTNTKEDYFPHLTFALLKGSSCVESFNSPESQLFENTHLFRMSLGVNGPFGMYKKTLSFLDEE